jgi:FtsP/CotA-like multicopper oxidase with cupredoxin domain
VYDRRDVRPRSPRCITWAAVLLALSCQLVAAESRVVELAIRGGALAPAQPVLRVQVGDDVTLRWTSDRALTLHVHGYDIESRVVPGAPTTMRFVARTAGRFPIERHDEQPGQETTLTYLEVHPR